MKTLGGPVVSRETLDKLSEYASLVEKWNPHVNLVSKRSLNQLWARHIMDSAQAVRHAPVDACHWLDLGSGGGFPGAVIAIILREVRPSAQVTLVEADQRKAVFLKTVSRELDIPMEIRPQRIEALPPQDADVVTARALAPLSKLLEYVSRHMKPTGCALLFKGSSAAGEVESALETWRFACESYPSHTNDESVILKIGEIERA